mgnify:CR=1 FL=1
MPKRKRSGKDTRVVPPAPPGRTRPRQANWRVQMCRYHLDGEECPHGDECNFAHGQHQLRTRGDNLRDGICTQEEREVADAKLYRYYGKPSKVIIACTTLSDWECLQQGLGYS